MSVVSEVEPELIVWQVGISDALAQADVAAFSEALNEVLAFFRAHRIDRVKSNISPLALFGNEASSRMTLTSPSPNAV